MENIKFEFNNFSEEIIFNFSDLTDKELYVYFTCLYYAYNEHGIWKNKLNSLTKVHLGEFMTLNEFFNCCKSLHRKKYIKKWYYNIHVNGNGGSMEEFGCVLTRLPPCMGKDIFVELSKGNSRLMKEMRDKNIELKELRYYIERNRSYDREEDILFYEELEKKNEEYRKRNEAFKREERRKKRRMKKEQLKNK